LRETIKARAATIDKESLFLVLGVPETASLDMLQAAYFALAKQWHPDRLPEELSDVKELAAKCFARMSEAFQTLSDSERRAQYQILLKQNAGSVEEQAQVQQVIEAAIDFQKAEVFLKKRELDSAEAHAKRAHQNDPEQGDYAAIYAWILVLLRDKAGIKDYGDSLRLLTTAIDREPRCEKAYFYRALVLQKQGMHDQAMRDFRKVNEINPRNIEAAREVRLNEMRGGKGSASDPDDTAKGGKGNVRSSQPKATGGLLGKLFKR
jgi:curved DNA-binding protein CbpA